MGTIRARIRTAGSRKLEKTFGEAGLDFIDLDQNLVDACWEGRPTATTQTAILLPESLTGRSSLDKRRAIAAAVADKGADAALVFAADSLAWLLNIRGQDVPCLPVVLGFGLLHTDGQLQFFTDPLKIPEGFDAHVGAGVVVILRVRSCRGFRGACWQKGSGRSRYGQCVVSAQLESGGCRTDRGR